MIEEDQRHRYVTLMASLPAPGSLRAATRVPLSRVQLDHRLKMLDEGDREIVRSIEALLASNRADPRIGDEQAVRRLKALMMQLDDPEVHELVTRLFEIRTAMAAIRRRERGEAAPRPDAIWGFGSHVMRIQRSWSAPTFDLDRDLPWLAEADRLYRSQEALRLERLLQEVHWALLDRASLGHYFDLMAVLVYVMRWNVIAWRVDTDPDLSARRFESLVEEGLGRWRQTRQGV
jgi:hypothetical protein